MKFRFSFQTWKLMQRDSLKYNETICFGFGNLYSKDYEF